MRAKSVTSLSLPCASALCLALFAAGCANPQGNGGAEPVGGPAAVQTEASGTIGSAAGAGVQTGESTANMATTLGSPAHTTPTPAPGAISRNAPPTAQGVPEPELLPPPPPRQAQAAAPAETPRPATPAAAPTASPAPAPAAPPQQAAAAPAVDAAAGRQLFNDWSCGTCHALGDAGGTGHIGPSFDGNSRLALASTIRIISDGQGAMPGFAGQLTDEEIATLAAYILQAKR